jgi:phosphoglycolate phosphatase
MISTSLKNTYDSIIFDLDGTLWDSTDNVAKAWQASKQQVDFINEDISPEMVAGIAGLTYDAIFEKLFPYLNHQQREEFKAVCAVNEIESVTNHGGILYPKLEETLSYLAGKYKLFIVSNCQNNYIEAFLSYSMLGHYFQGHQCFGTKGAPKAENIKDIVINHDLKSPVYVGDTTGDFTSSQKAGVPFIFAAYGFGKVDEGQVATIKHLSDLIELL